MIRVKLSGNTFPIPTSWDDVHYIDFARSRNKPLHERLSIYSGIPQDVIDSCELDLLKPIIDTVSFQDTIPEYFKEVKLEINIGDEHYIKMEQSRKLLETSENQWLAAIQITKLYTDKDISQMPVLDSMGYAVFFLKQLTPSLKSMPV